MWIWDDTIAFSCLQHVQRTQLFHFISTEPGKVILVQPCTASDLSFSRPHDFNFSTHRPIPFSLLMSYSQRITDKGWFGYCTQSSTLQGPAKTRSPGLVNFIIALAYHFCLALPAAFTQPRYHLLAEPCILSFIVKVESPFLRLVQPKSFFRYPTRFAVLN